MSFYIKGYKPPVVRLTGTVGENIIATIKMRKKICFPYSYHSSNYCDNNSCRSFTLLKALAKSNSNLLAIAFKSENFSERDIKKEAKNW